MDHPWSNGWPAFRAPTRSRARKASSCSRRRWSPCCPTTCSIAPRWGLPFRWPTGSVAPSGKAGA
jgi:hypothetical protein